MGNVNQGKEGKMLEFQRLYVHKVEPVYRWGRTGQVIGERKNFEEIYTNLITQMTRSQ